MPCLISSGMRLAPESEPLRAERVNMRLRPAGLACERGCRRGNPHRFVPGLPARVGEPAPGGQSVRLLAHRCAASNYSASGTPCLTHRRADGETAGAAAAEAVV